MKILFNIIWVLLLLGNTNLMGQTADTIPSKNDSITLITQTRLDTLKNAIVLTKNWRYHSGDDTIWATKNFDDSSWPILSTDFKIDSLAGESWQGIGWFRKKFKIDSTLYNKAVAFTMSQQAASEIYLNGKLIHSYGTINADPQKEELYDPFYTPFIAVFDTSSTQILAIRYSNQKAQLFNKRYPGYAESFGFNLRVSNSEKAFESNIGEIKVFSLITMVGSFFLVLTFLHLLLFFFYSRGKENLYYALFTGAILMIVGFIFYLNLPYRISDFRYLLVYGANIIFLLSFLGYVFFLYAIFYNKMPKQSRVIILFWIIISITSLLKATGEFVGKFVLFPFVLLLTAEGLRVIILAIKRKKKDSLIIGIGVSLFFMFVIFIGVSILFSLNESNLLVVITSLFGALLSVPITMTIYLARTIARTKIDLENRIVQVQELSDKAIAHEKREAELRVENARKEVELQKAAELKSAYADLEKAHENLKSTQTQLIQSEKMASLGALTAGIAHEIQNPLNFVNNFSDVSTELLEELKKEIENGNLDEVRVITTDLKQNLEKINNHGQRASSIVKGMLLHSRGSSGQKEPTDINLLCDEYLRLSYHGFRAKDKSFNANFKLEADESLPKIEVVPQDIGRVLINLINNAFYAVNEKVKQGMNDYKPTVVVNTKFSNKYKIEIKVYDNGNGIPDSVKEKIFQPFFTTKPAGKGTGLGLSLSYDIIKVHGGTLEVESSLSEGTKFIIKLPANS